MSKFDSIGIEMFGYGSVEESVGTDVKKVPKLSLDEDDTDSKKPASKWWVDVREVEDQQWIDQLCPMDCPAEVFHLCKTEDSAAAELNKSAKLSKRQIDKVMTKYCDPQNLVRYNEMLDKFSKTGFEEGAALKFLQKGAD